MKATLPARELNILGVPGKIKEITPKIYTKREPNPACFGQQVWTSEIRKRKIHDTMHYIEAKIRFDDECGNGHNSFAITGNYWEVGQRRDSGGGGCIHDEIAKAFPELASLIRWHLFDSDGPMHYIANTTYHASNRDYRGKLKGEPYGWDTQIKFGDFPIKKTVGDKFAAWLQAAVEFNASVPKTNPNRRDFVIVEIPYTGKVECLSSNYSFDDYCKDWHMAPFKSRAHAEEFKAALAWGFEVVKTPTLFSEGKERDLDAARCIAVWPDASDEVLCLPKEELTKLLEERLPALLNSFRADIERAGLMWSAEDLPDA